MKRRGWLFLLVLLVALIGVYAQPILFPRVNQVPRVVDNNQEGVTTALKAKPIKASGFASMIGKSTTSLDKTYGKPQKSYTTGHGFSINSYQTLENEYLEVNLVDEKIAAIKVMGQVTENLAPFNMGMTMAELSKITMIYPNFTVAYQEQELTFELMEEDMNYRPLLSFDNGTYGMLFFNQTDGKLFGIMYLDVEMLLKLSPYTLVSGQLPRFENTRIDVEAAARAQEEQAYAVVNRLREVDELATYPTNFTLQGKAADLLIQVQKEPEKRLGKEQGQLYKNLQTMDDGQKVVIIGDPFQDLIKQFNLGDKMTGFLETPCYDITYQLMTAYADPYVHTKFLGENQVIGIGIEAKNMVILLEEEVPTKDSGQE